MAVVISAANSHAQLRQPARATLQPPQAELTPFAREKARILLSTQLSCLGCHRLSGDGGSLAPPLDDVRSRRDAAYIARIIEDPASVRPGLAMPRSRMPATQRVLIVRYLGGIPSATPVATTPVGAGQGSDAATIYKKWCAGCHGNSGKGDGPNAKALPVAPSPHASASRMQLVTDDALFDTIFGGGLIMNRSARMPSFGETLSTEQIRSLVKYIRQLCVCEGPRWSRDGAN